MSADVANNAGGDIAEAGRSGGEVEKATILEGDSSLSKAVGVEVAPSAAH